MLKAPAAKAFAFGCIKQKKQRNKRAMCRFNSHVVAWKARALITTEKENLMCSDQVQSLSYNNFIFCYYNLKSC